MRILYILLLILPCLTSSAQVTLTLAAHGRNPGTTQSVYEADTASYTPGSAGASQTWNFSGLNISGSAYTTNYISPLLYSA